MEGKKGSAAREPEVDAAHESETGAARETGESASAHAGVSAGKRRTKRWPIIVGVVAVVLIAAGAGFWVWHEQPSFCNAICHDPMDAYVGGYYNDATLMANTHERANVTCLECHEAKIDEQVTEGLAWVRGDFATDETGHLITQGVTADKAMCTTAGCHEWKDVKAATEDWGGVAGVNPHDSHQGEAIDCSNCHEAHGTSYMYCNTCHDYETPEGWADPAKGGEKR